MNALIHADPLAAETLRPIVGPLREVPLAQVPHPPGPPLTVHDRVAEALRPTPPAPETLLPANPVDAVLNGLHIPALPGIDQLFAPIGSLLNGVGPGVFSAISPTMVFKESSNLLLSGMKSCSGLLQAVDYAWQGLAADSAKAAVKKSVAGGQEIAGQGHSLADTAQAAAESAQRGNAKLGAIAQSFASTAVAAAPVILTPPGQAMLMAAAAEHLTQALTVVSHTRAELGTHAAKLGGAVGPVPIPPPPCMDPVKLADLLVQAAIPITGGVTGVVGDVMDTASKAAATTAAKSPQAQAHSPLPQQHSSAAPQVSHQSVVSVGGGRPQAGRVLPPPRPVGNGRAKLPVQPELGMPVAEPADQADPGPALGGIGGMPGARPADRGTRNRLRKSSP